MHVPCWNLINSQFRMDFWIYTCDKRYVASEFTRNMISLCLPITHEINLRKHKFWVRYNQNGFSLVSRTHSSFPPLYLYLTQYYSHFHFFEFNFMFYYFTAHQKIKLYFEDLYVAAKSESQTSFTIIIQLYLSFCGRIS